MRWVLRVPRKIPLLFKMNRFFQDDPLLKKLRKNIFSYVEKNMAMVVVYIRDPYATRYVTGERMGAITFTGSIGGLMGLLLGGSAMSLIEVIYFCVVGALHYLMNLGGRSAKVGTSGSDNVNNAANRTVVNKANKWQNEHFDQPRTGNEPVFHI